MFLASIYGGYFGGGLSVIVLAVLALVAHDSLTRLNALKQVIAFCVNVSAAIFFLFSGKVVWSAALVMAVGALAGGAVGGLLGDWIRPQSTLGCRGGGMAAQLYISFGRRFCIECNAPNRQQHFSEVGVRNSLCPNRLLPREPSADIYPLPKVLSDSS